jgi:hypothetical protein
MVKFICWNCGAVNMVNETSIGDEVEWLDCLEPDGFEWKLPAGKITPVVGPEIYISATGEQLSRAQYIKKFNIDPERAYKFMRSNKYVPDNCHCDKQQEAAKGSLSALIKKSSSRVHPAREQESALSSRSIRAPAWAEEEDWV